MQTKHTFVKLQTLASSCANDARWQENVQSCGVADGLTFATENEETGEGDLVLQEFAADELENDVDKVMYDFAGNPGFPERFYERDEMIYKDKVGNFWVLESDDLYEF